MQGPAEQPDDPAPSSLRRAPTCASVQECPPTLAGSGELHHLDSDDLVAAERESEVGLPAHRGSVTVRRKSAFVGAAQLDDPIDLFHFPAAEFNLIVVRGIDEFAQLVDPMNDAR